MPENHSSSIILIIITFLLLTTFETLKIQAKIHISDDLDDVVDDEEDESWKEWGKKKSTTNPSKSDPPPVPDFSKLSPQEIQAQMMKQQIGPVFGFAKLRPGIRRTREMVTEIAMKWSKVARTGAIEAKFSGFDLGTIMITMERGQDIEELQEFLLSQPEAYEIKIGDQLFRREGDPPFEEVIEKLHSQKNQQENKFDEL